MRGEAEEHVGEKGRDDKEEEEEARRREGRRKRGVRGRQQELWATCYRFSLRQCLYNGKGRATERLNSQTCQGELSRFVISIFCVCETECL